MKEKSQKRAFPQKLTEWKEHLLLGSLKKVEVIYILCLFKL